ncbi:LOW QUALITY PROTEIN: FAD binding domain-containing protein [Colletotrichum tofieldiae]|nr:LOW QUALITY PROTEIN: FAD binding domain-containing protein [Colletotrichum tofieldiae]GKT77673.1 LOW QUALITY PROTEIN: FAD binding domain-containing protein [Colletotrichum tofieldiae]
MGFRAIIVGGSVSGLSLANMLEQLGTDYILLEAHHITAPQLGDSIGMLPNGLRTLDQPGCYETIRDKSRDFYNHTNMRGADGCPLMKTKFTSLSKRIGEVTGYPCIFIDRQVLLQVLHNNIKNKEKIPADNRVTGVEVASVGFISQHGSSYDGDFLLGADGVHSTTRKETWRLANRMSPGLFSPDEGSSACNASGQQLSDLLTANSPELKSHTKCIFGISPRPATFPYHTQDPVFYKGWSCLVVSAPGDRVYWFLLDIPRYTKEDEADLANQHLDDTIIETGTFRPLYETRHVATLVPLQEHVFARRHFRKIVTVGDSAHKGGNGAIESAAVLVNAIVRKMEERPEGLSEEALDATFGEVCTNRRDRARAVVKQGEKMQSITNLEGPFSGLLIRHLVPLFGDALFLNSFLKTSLAGPRIEKMDLPHRPHTTSFNGERVARSVKYNWELWSAAVLVSGLAFMHY